MENSRYQPSIDVRRVENKQKILSVCNFFKPLDETSETSPAESKFE